MPFGFGAESIKGAEHRHHCTNTNETAVLMRACSCSPRPMIDEKERGLDEYLYKGEVGIENRRKLRD